MYVFYDGVVSQTDVYTQFRQGMLTACVDLKKMFDSVPGESLWDPLRLRAITTWTIEWPALWG